MEKKLKKTKKINKKRSLLLTMAIMYHKTMLSACVLSRQWNYTALKRPAEGTMSLHLKSMNDKNDVKTINLRKKNNIVFL